MEHPVYSLIQAVNPNNIVIPIRDPLEKFTLSSNKKKKVIKTPTPEKRHSASRNLLSQLSDAGGDNKENNNSSEAHHECNPILLSGSSKSMQPGGEYTMMESLYMTDDEYESPGAGTEVNLENIGDLDQLCEAFANGCAFVDKAISVSPASSHNRNGQNSVCDEVNLEEIGDLNQLSQAFANGCRFVDKAISVSSSSSDNRNEQNSVCDEGLLENERVGENEEEEYDGDDSDDDDRPITIPDSSSDSIDNENVMAISAVPLVDEPIITYSISSHKSQQLQAFLQDCKHLVQQRQYQMNFQEIMDNLAGASTLHSEDSEINECVIATANSESVTEQENINAINIKQETNANFYNHAKLLAQVGTPEQSDDELILEQNIYHERLDRLGILSSPEKKSSAAQKIDDTVPNTLADRETYYDGENENENTNMQQKYPMELAETLPNTEVSIMEDVKRSPIEKKSMTPEKNDDELILQQNMQQERLNRLGILSSPEKKSSAAQKLDYTVPNTTADPDETYYDDKIENENTNMQQKYPMKSAEILPNTEVSVMEDEDVKRSPRYKTPKNSLESLQSAETMSNIDSAETISNTEESIIEERNVKSTSKKSLEPLHAAGIEHNTNLAETISVTQQENSVAINIKQETNANLYNHVKLLARVETESMTPEQNDDELILQQNIQQERLKRLGILSSPEKKYTAAQKLEQERLKRLGILSSPEKKYTAAQKLDDTAPNTIADRDETYYVGENENDNTNMQQKCPMKLAKNLPNTEVSFMEDVKSTSKKSLEPLQAAETEPNTNSLQLAETEQENIVAINIKQETNSNLYNHAKLLGQVETESMTPEQKDDGLILEQNILQERLKRLGILSSPEKSSAAQKLDNTVPNTIADPDETYYDGENENENTNVQHKYPMKLAETLPNTEVSIMEDVKSTSKKSLEPLQAAETEPNTNLAETEQENIVAINMKQETNANFYNHAKLLAQVETESMTPEENDDELILQQNIQQGILSSPEKKYTAAQKLEDTAPYTIADRDKTDYDGENENGNTNMQQKCSMKLAETLPNTEVSIMKDVKRSPRYKIPKKSLEPLHVAETMSNSDLAGTISVTEQENSVAINIKQETNANLNNHAKFMSQVETESMTPEQNDDGLILQQNIQQERLKRLGILSSPEKKSSAAQKLDDTVPNTIADPDETDYDGENENENTNMQQKCPMKLAETLPNTDVSIMEDEYVKRSPRYKTPKKSLEPLHAAETMSSLKYLQSVETISNTEKSIIKKQNVKNTPKKSFEPLHAAETEANIEKDSLILSDTDNDDDSYFSFKSQTQSIPQQEEEFFINSSSENIAFNTTPNESFTILETDEEAGSENVLSRESNSCKKYQSPAQSNNTSFVETDYQCSEMQDIQMSMSNINISDKINIKTHAPNDSTKSSDVDSDKLSSNDGECNKQQRQSMLANVERSFSQQMQMQQQPTMTNNDESFGEKNFKSAPANDDVDFLTQSEKLLSQLYGESWQTPEVIRTLKKTSATDFKKKTKQKLDYSDKENTPFKMPITFPKHKESAKKILETTAKQQNPASAKKPKDISLNNNREVEESVLLDDFSMFRNNIVDTNLDSTRLTKNPRIRRAAAIALTKRWQDLFDIDSESEADNSSDDEYAAVTDQSDDDDDEDEPKNNRKKSNHRNLSAEDKYESDDNQIVYLDLTKDKVEILNSSTDSPPANHDAVFAERLQNILKSCTPAIELKLSATTKNKKSKRKLFTPNFGEEEELLQNVNDSALKKSIAKNINIVSNNNKHNAEETVIDDFATPFDGRTLPKIIYIHNKKLESVKTGKPILAITPPSLKTKLSKGTPSKTAAVKIPKHPAKTKPAQKHAELSSTPNYKYCFLKSLDPAVSKLSCHPDALYYRNNYCTKRVELSQILYDMYNEKLFKNELNVPVQWDKKLTNTAGRCLNKKRLGTRISLIELSEKVLTNADLLRCTLIHEMCHAATWIFNGEGGHGATWMQWASQANAIFPEIPKIVVCHQYEIRYKYTYKCTLCAAKSYAQSESKKVENMRCSYCHGAIEIFLNKKDKDGNVIPSPVRESTGFAKFVKDNYKKFKNDKFKHSDVMKLLSNEFASMKIEGDAAEATNTN